MCVPALELQKLVSHLHALLWQVILSGILILLIWVAERNYKLFVVRELGLFSSPVVVPHVFLTFYRST